MPITSLLSLAAVTTLLIMSLVAVAAEEDQAVRPMALPGCLDKCGNISIPYSFGTKEGCYFDAGFYINCNLSYTPPSASVSGILMKKGSGYYLENQADMPGIRNNDDGLLYGSLTSSTLMLQRVWRGSTGLSATTAT